MTEPRGGGIGRGIWAYEPSPLALVRSRPLARRVVRLLGLLAPLVILFFIFAPWRQSVGGSGRVIAFSPNDREQKVVAPIKGRIVTWHVHEGSVVKKGDVMVDLADNDPELLQRLRDQRTAALNRVSSARLAITVGRSRVSSVESARRAATSTAELAVSIARDKRDAATQELLAAKAAFETAELNRARLEALERDQLASRRELELAQLEQVSTKSRRAAAEAKMRAANGEIEQAQAKLANVISKETAEVHKAEESLAKLEQELAKAEGDLLKAEVELSRQTSMSVTAPRDGTVLRLVANAEGQWVKPGEPVAVLVPQTQSRAVELWLSGNDAPLVTPGREVRLQFDGWPAVQFSGWPSVAVGTFGGRVALVDASDDGKGRFRAVVVPTEEEPWPEARYLRQGVRAKGWVLLDEVTVGFEIWRQLNGLPPAVDAPPDVKPAYGPSKAKGEEEEG
ncbi:MAG: HlyD family efflux transporter periplasmic adaptor subunit [Deltaproteobacteria bacterium]|nr:MAG: HlyD family efflux transporter periplasmic adaptor subunit [Deltaproteobacteria bacterium]